MSEATDIAELIRKFGEMGKLSLCIEAADEIDSLRHRLDIAEQTLKLADELIDAQDETISLFYKGLEPEEDLESMVWGLRRAFTETIDAMRKAGET
jgi:hypothetical protein